MNFQEYCAPHRCLCNAFSRLPRQHLDNLDLLAMMQKTRLHETWKQEQNMLIRGAIRTVMVHLDLHPRDQVHLNVDNLRVRGN